MKNINYVINGILAVAVVILFVMQFSGKKEMSVTRTFTTGDDAPGLLPIAYVNVDSLMSNYNYSKDLNEIILKKQENSRASITQKARVLQTEMAEFQRKVENNAFLTRERGEQEQQRLVNKQQELQELDNRLAQELMAEQQKLNEQLRDTVVAQLKVFNETRGYQVIFSNTLGDNVLLAGDAYDITAELLEQLNKNYAPAAAVKE
ncbi:MAG: OmpH family outer membrane protein [Tannerellaceae bacterium]